MAVQKCDCAADHTSFPQLHFDWCATRSEPENDYCSDFNEDDLVWLNSLSVISLDDFEEEII